MSAETEYLQRFINLKRAFETDPRFEPRATGLPWRMQIGIEITIVESNRCDAYFDSSGRFQTSISTGQKSYIRGTGSDYIEVFGGVQLGTGGVPTPSLFTAGLRFPNPSNSLERWYAFDRASTTWVFDTPFQNKINIRPAAVEVSLVPFRLSAEPSIGAGGIPEQSDDRVHVLIQHFSRQVVLLSDVTLDQRTQQLYGYGPSMEPVDNAALWILSFYIAPGNTA